MATLKSRPLPPPTTWPTPSAPPLPDTQPLLFSDLGPRRVVADFSGGYLSSDGGALLLRQIDRRLGLSRAVAACFVDQRNPIFVEHAVQEMAAQRTKDRKSVEQGQSVD